MGVITVFSASNYSGMDNNYGAVATIVPRKGDQPLQIVPSRHAVLPGDALETLKRVSRFGSFTSATLTLQSHNQNEWEKLAKKECFDILCTVIFTRRHKLLIECQQKDTKQDERILYIPFLERYQNILASKCMRQWVKQIRPYIAERLCTRAKGASLNFSELAEAMREELPGMDVRSVYCFLMASDVYPGHSINIKALRKQALKEDVKAPGAIDLWVMRECRSMDWEDFKERWVQMVWGPRATSQEFPTDPIAVQA